MKTAEEILIKKCLEHENRYVSFPSLIENEGSVEANSVALDAMHEYADQWKYDFLILLDALLESEINRIKKYNYIYFWDKKTGWNSVYNFA